MAYLSDLEILCQAIVDVDLAYVKKWCEREGSAAAINERDHTGRTPLHLATLCGNLEIVKCLIDHGARIVARVEGGFTALHIAAHRGYAGIVSALIQKSEENKQLLEHPPTARPPRKSTIIYNV
jgi:ankyrin repeat protein